MFVAVCCLFLLGFLSPLHSVCVWWSDWMFCSCQQRFIPHCWSNVFPALYSRSDRKQRLFFHSRGKFVFVFSFRAVLDATFSIAIIPLFFHFPFVYCIFAPFLLATSCFRSLLALFRLCLSNNVAEPRLAELDFVLIVIPFPSNSLLFKRGREGELTLVLSNLQLGNYLAEWKTRRRWRKTVMRTKRDSIVATDACAASIVSYFCLFRLPFVKPFILFSIFYFFLQDARALIISYLVLATRRDDDAEHFFSFLPFLHSSVGCRKKRGE